MSLSKLSELYGEGEENNNDENDVENDDFPENWGGFLQKCPTCEGELESHSIAELIYCNLMTTNKAYQICDNECTESGRKIHFEESEYSVMQHIYLKWKYVKENKDDDEETINKKIEDFDKKIKIAKNENLHTNLGGWEPIAVMVGGKILPVD